MIKLPVLPPTTTTLAIRLTKSVDRSRLTRQQSSLLVSIPSSITVGLLAHD